MDIFGIQGSLLIILTGGGYGSSNHELPEIAHKGKLEA